MCSRRGGRAGVVILGRAGLLRAQSAGVFSIRRSTCRPIVRIASSNDGRHSFRSSSAARFFDRSVVRRVTGRVERVDAPAVHNPQEGFEHGRDVKGSRRSSTDLLNNKQGERCEMLRHPIIINRARDTHRFVSITNGCPRGDNRRHFAGSKILCRCHTSRAQS